LRRFDAVAALVGLRDRVSYEGQAAAELEWLSTGVSPDTDYPYALLSSPPDGPPGPTIVDTRPLIREIAQDIGRGVDAARVGQRFHATVVDLIAAVCVRIRAAGGPETVALSGGVFLNALLTREAAERLTRDGFRVYRHRLVPPCDGGLSLGQLAVAAAIQPTHGLTPAVLEEPRV
jgi:hydrogenase maturation protein HypF